jgi:hypothetical protein
MHELHITCRFYRCIYTHMCIYVYTKIYICTCIDNMYIYITCQLLCTYMCVCVYACNYLCIYTHGYKIISLYSYVYICIRVCCSLVCDHIDKPPFRYMHIPGHHLQEFANIARLPFIEPPLENRTDLVTLDGAWERSITSMLCCCYEILSHVSHDA